ncbi:hypothetical protein M422DRAFT_30033 [Sphaerobolus stellatus SS14]|uniref:Uncharacterized protein n=1 Tax=Sphaerobolus stellatus (strain SS14) TaxID=990650 RepID=A0A0C9W132_SPHS4|nr:hypothetical protein M422DRAFT_30033 [Sphaerobolus stellatus SS14]
MERYEAARRRWSECSREEWERGADELIGRVSKVFDFVKDHVKRQVSVYTSLHTQVNDQKKICEGRTQTLDNARIEMVAKTGIVVDADSI